MKRYIKWGLLFGGVFIIVVMLIMTENVKFNSSIIEKLEKEDPVIFSAFLKGEINDEGTYFYELGDDNLQKVSDEKFFEISYNEDKSKFLGKVRNDVGDNKNTNRNGFEGIAEYDLEKDIFIPIITLAELQDLFEDPEMEISEVHGPQYYKGDYSVYYKGKVYKLKKAEDRWTMRVIGEAVGQESWGVYIWDKYQENLYVRVETNYKEWKLIKYNVKTKKYDVLLSDVNQFRISKNEDKIVYESYVDNKIYLYDVETEEKVLLAQYKGDIWIDSIVFSEDEDFVLYVEQKYGAIDREAMYKFCIIDMETNKKKLIKDWGKEVTFFGIGW